MSFPAKLIRFFFTLLVIIVPLIFLPNTSELFEFNKMIITYILTLFIIVAWISRMILEKRLIFTKTLLDWPLLIFLIIQLLSLLLSIDPRTSLLGYYSRFNGGFISMLGYSLLYWSAVSNLDRKSTLSIVHWSLISAGLVASWGFLEHFGIDAHLWVQDVRNRVFSTLGQPNWLAAYLVALIFIPISRLTSKIGWWSASLSLLLFIVLLFTKSRSGLLAFGICFVIFMGIYLKKLGKLEIRSIKNLLFISLLTLTLTLTIKNPIHDLVFSKLNMSNEQLVMSNVPGGTSLETGGTESGTIRKIVWTGALRIWQSSSKNLWIGTGPETFAMAYYQHRPKEHNATSEWELLYNKAHNEFLNYLATTGLLGFGSYLILLGTMFVTFLKFQSPSTKIQTNSKSQIPNHKSLDLVTWNFIIPALLAGWLSISITNFWGFSVVIVQIFLFLFPAFAVTLNQETPNTKYSSQTTWQNLAQLILFTSGFIILYSIFNYWQADVAYANGQKTFRMFNASQDPEYVLDSYRNFSRAFELNPADSPISSELGVTAAFMSLMLSQNDPQAAAQLTDISEMASNRAIAGSPYHPNYYKSRSRAMVVLGTVNPEYFKKSDESLKAAQLISPTDPRIPYIRAINAKYDNQPDLAIKYLQEALVLKPDFADAKAQLQLLATPSATTK